MGQRRKLSLSDFEFVGFGRNPNESGRKGVEKLGFDPASCEVEVDEGNFLNITQKNPSMGFSLSHHQWREIIKT